MTNLLFGYLIALRGWGWVPSRLRENKFEFVRLKKIVIKRFTQMLRHDMQQNNSFILFTHKKPCIYYKENQTLTQFALKSIVHYISLESWTRFIIFSLFWSGFGLLRRLTWTGISRRIFFCNRLKFLDKSPWATRFWKFNKVISFSECYFLYRT